MNKRLGLLFGVSALALLLVATPALADEVDVSGENTNTGADSKNKNEYDIDNKFKADVDNFGDVVNKAKADVDTGDNKQIKNTEGGDIDTGAVDASTDWESVVNAAAGFAGGEAGELDVMADFLNDTTGAKSRNKNKLDVENKHKLDLDNIAYILNKLKLDADTGDNKQIKNTTAGDIDTGGVDVASGILNEANNGSGFAGAVAGSTTVDVTAENSKTGADSRNKNEVDVKNKVRHNVTNTANINNKIKVDADTGGNKQIKNTTAGDIDTGGVDVTADMQTFANNGSGVAGAAGHSLGVKANLVNDTTGADSKNKNTVDVENKVKVNVTNTANVDNKLKVDADTGDNKQIKNTTGGDISTGDVSIDFNSVTEVNSN